MPHPRVPPVEALRVHAVELAHPLGEIGLGRLDQDVIVIAHLAPGMAGPIETRTDIREHYQPDLSIRISQVNVFPPIPTRGDVIQPTGKFKS